MKLLSVGCGAGWIGENPEMLARPVVEINRVLVGEYARRRSPLE